KAQAGGGARSESREPRAESRRRARPCPPARVGDRRGRPRARVLDAPRRRADDVVQAHAAAAAAPVHDRARGAADALQRRRRRLPREPREARTRLTRVHQVLSGAGPVDAVTAQAFEYRRLFTEWGIDGGVYAAAIEPAVRGQVEPVKRLEPAADDVLLF